MAEKLLLPTGRSIDYLISGAKQGFPFIFCHGTLGSHLPFTQLAQACEKRNVQLITFSRPGTAGSARQRGRRVVDVVADVKAILSHLGVQRCVVGGWSGGGPHALACAARLPECIAGLIVASVAPYDAEGLDWMAGQGEDNVEEWNAALESEDAITRYCEERRANRLSGDAAQLVQELATVLPAADRDAVLSHRYIGPDLVNATRESLKINCDGWIDDMLSFIKPWGFELDEVRKPILLYHGGEDLMVPVGHGTWLARHLPAQSLQSHFLEGQGHFSVFIGQEESMVDQLIALANPC